MPCYGSRKAQVCSTKSVWPFSIALRGSSPPTYVRAGLGRSERSLYNNRLYEVDGFSQSLPPGWISPIPNRTSSLLAEYVELVVYRQAGWIICTVSAPRARRNPSNDQERESAVLASGTLSLVLLIVSAGPEAPPPETLPLPEAPSRGLLPFPVAPDDAIDAWLPRSSNNWFAPGGVRGCGGPHCAQCRGSFCWDWWISPCDMVQHSPYYPAMHGNYYFRPYNAYRILQHQQAAVAWGEDPRNPYSNDVFRRVYAKMKEQGAGPDVEEPPAPPKSELPASKPPAVKPPAAQPSAPMEPSPAPMGPPPPPMDVEEPTPVPPEPPATKLPLPKAP